MGFFGDLFDFNHDGKMDDLEKAAEFSFFMNMIEEENEEDEDGDEESEYNDD